MNLLLPHFILIVFAHMHITLLPSYLVLINKLETSMLRMLPKEDLPEMEESAGKMSRTVTLEGVLQSYPCRPLKSGAGPGPLKAWHLKLIHFLS